MAEAKPNEKKAPKLESEISTRPPSLPSKSGESEHLSSTIIFINLHLVYNH